MLATQTGLAGARAAALGGSRSVAARGVSLPSRPIAPRARRVSVAARAALSVHTVQSGENLWAIARARGVACDELVAVNASALGGSDVIYPGQQLVIPSGGKPPAPDAFKPPSSSSFKSYGSSARSSAGFDPARLVEGKGLGLVTAGAFFIALAVGIAAFKEDPYKRPRDTRGDDGGYDDRGYDDQAGAADYGQQQGYYDQYNRGEWQQYEGTWSSRPANPPTDRGEQYPGQGNPNIW